MLGFPTVPQYFNHASAGPGPSYPGAGTIRWMESVFCGAPDEVIPLPRDPVEACGRNPIAVYDETSQPKSAFTESL
jgi:hypothetical protein